MTNRDLIIALAARYGVPAIYFNRLFAESGGLINYSPDFAEQFRQAPEYIDRILKGAKPADLPVQAADKVRADHQSQDRQGVGPRRAVACCSADRRRGDRIKRSAFAATRWVDFGPSRPHARSELSSQSVE